VKALSTPWLRVLLLPVLLGLLGGCAVYDRVFHPHRLPTPPLSATAKAKARAAEKARHKGTSLKAMEATSATATDGAGADPAAPADEKKKTMSYSDLPEGTKLKYDKQGLVKKGTLDRLEDNRRKLHHYDTRPLTPREASRENRKLRKKGHQDHKGAKDPAPTRDKEQPAEAPPPPPPAPAPAPPPPPPAPRSGKPLQRLHRR